MCQDFSTRLDPGEPYVLLTGATGVIGSSVLGELAPRRVIALAHNSQPPQQPGLVVARGDVAKPLLGMSSAGYDTLVDHVECVINCGGRSHAGSGEEALRAVNVDGARALITFCRAAGSRLVHVGTAAEMVDGGGDESRFSVAPYLRTKREADRLVEESGIDAVIAKPSQVIGDSDTGYTPHFQGIHKLADMLLGDELGVLPIAADARVDVVPRDLVARAIVMLARGHSRGKGECLLTAGTAAPTAEQTVEIITGVAASRGLRPRPVRFVEPDVIDRLVRPVILPELPRRARARLEYAIEFSRLVHAREDADLARATALPALTGDGTLTAETVREALWRSIAYWADAVGLGVGPSEIAV